MRGPSVIISNLACVDDISLSRRRNNWRTKDKNPFSMWHNYHRGAEQTRKEHGQCFDCVLRRSKFQQVYVLLRVMINVGASSAFTLINSLCRPSLPASPLHNLITHFQNGKGKQDLHLVLRTPIASSLHFALSIWHCATGLLLAFTLAPLPPLFYRCASLS